MNERGGQAVPPDAHGRVGSTERAGGVSGRGPHAYTHARTHGGEEGSMEAGERFCLRSQHKDKQGLHPWVVRDRKARTRLDDDDDEGRRSPCILSWHASLGEHSPPPPRRGGSITRPLPTAFLYAIGFLRCMAATAEHFSVSACGLLSPPDHHHHHASLKPQTPKPPTALATHPGQSPTYPQNKVVEQPIWQRVRPPGMR